MCEIGRCITGMDNRSNKGRFGYLSEGKILLIFSPRNNDSLRWGSESESQAKVDQKTRPYEQCVEDDQLIGSINFDFDPLDCSIYIEEVVLYLGYHHDLLENHLEGEVEKSSQKFLGYPQNAKTELR